MLSAIPVADVLVFIKSLGADPDEVRSVLLTPDAVAVVEYRRDESGHRFAIGDAAATVTTEICIERGA